MAQAPRHQLYRVFLHHLQKIPDRHVWATTLPKFRALLEAQPSAIVAAEVPIAESSRAAALRASRAARGLKRARKDLHHLQAAVSAQPHALLRLLEKAYGLRGAVRWDLIRSIEASSPPQQGKLPHRPGLPPCLVPFRPEPVRAREKPSPRLETRVKPTAVRLAAKREWTRDWEKVKAPLVLPDIDGGPRTGWEGVGVIEELRRSAGLSPPHEPSSNPAESAIHLPTHIERLFPSSRTPNRDLPPYPMPPPSHTRENPHTWSFPRQLNARLFRNTYRRIWRQLVWCRPTGESGEWQACTYEEMLAASQGGAAGETTGKKVAKVKKKGQKVENGYFSQASAEDLRWI